MFAKMLKTNGEPYTGRLVRTVRGQAPGNLPSQDGKALGAEPTIYHYLKCKKPFKRLWISSLTDTAIRSGIENLKGGKEYNNLYLSAYARAQADWMIGINASQSLCITSGIGNNSLGRVQTPTLAMICKRYLEHIHFVSKPYWQLKLQLEKQGKTVLFTCNDIFEEKQAAEKIYNKLKVIASVKVSGFEHKVIKEEPPLLYDLTALQKEANTLYGMTAEETLAVAQQLYEKKLITYPRTGSRYIPTDVFETIPSLLGKLTSHSLYAAYAVRLKQMKLNRNSVNNRKVTDHHAILITENNNIILEGNEELVYNLIAGRMLEAFSPVCIKESLTIEANCSGLIFRTSCTRITDKGWRQVLNRQEENVSEKEESSLLDMEDFQEGELLKILSHNLIQSKTRAKPLLTEASLLTSMENAGQDLEDDEQRKALKDMGIGTPATRASIIETLFRREYIERDGKNLLPTKKGLFIYDAVRNMRIADVELTGSWEKALLKIEKDAGFMPTFLEAIKIHTRQITDEIISLRMPKEQENACICPKCKRGQMNTYHKVAKCTNSTCNFIVYRQIAGKNITDNQIRQLLTEKKTSLIKGFKNKDGKSFDAILSFEKDFNITFSFPERKNN